MVVLVQVECQTTHAFVPIIIITFFIYIDEILLVKEKVTIILAHYFSVIYSLFTLFWRHLITIMSNSKILWLIIMNWHSSYLVPVFIKSYFINASVFGCFNEFAIFEFWLVINFIRQCLGLTSLRIPRFLRAKNNFITNWFTRAKVA